MSTRRGAHASEHDKDSAVTATGGRLRRGTLSRTAIVDAALEVMDEPGLPTLTFARLGRVLGASPSAVYRHFANRDDLIDAVGDELIRRALNGYQPLESWADSLWDLSERAWFTYAQHPGAASQAYFRITRGINELRAVDAILEALNRAGLSDEDAVLHYQAFSSLVLALSADHAAKLGQLLATGDTVEEKWDQVYVPRDPEEYPYYWAVRDQLRRPDAYRIFRRQIDMAIDAIRRAAHEDNGAVGG